MDFFAAVYASAVCAVSNESADLRVPSWLKWAVCAVSRKGAILRALSRLDAPTNVVDVRDSAGLD